MFPLRLRVDKLWLVRFTLLNFRIREIHMGFRHQYVRIVKSLSVHRGVLLSADEAWD